MCLGPRITSIDAKRIYNLRFVGHFMKTQFPYVSSEGGPILVGDSADLLDWNGSDLTLYNRACEVEQFGVIPIEFGGKTALSWDFGGPGTAFLVKSERTEAIFLRIWSDSDLSDNAMNELVEISNEYISTASLTLRSGRLLAIWAPEDATEIVAPADGFGRPTGLSMGGTAYFLSLDAGRYAVTSSHYFKNEDEVAALRLKRIDDRDKGPSLFAIENQAT
jgi:hypothetical protein